MLESAPTTTSPMTTAPGATQALASIHGSTSPKLLRTAETLAVAVSAEELTLDLVAAFIEIGVEKRRLDVALTKVTDRRHYHLVLVAGLKRVFDRT